MTHLLFYAQLTYIAATDSSGVPFTFQGRLKFQVWDNAYLDIIIS